MLILHVEMSINPENNSKKSVDVIVFESEKYTPLSSLITLKIIIIVLSFYALLIQYSLICCDGNFSFDTSNNNNRIYNVSSYTKGSYILNQFDLMRLLRQNYSNGWHMNITNNANKRQRDFEKTFQSLYIDIL